MDMQAITNMAKAISAGSGWDFVRVDDHDVESIAVAFRHPRHGPVLVSLRENLSLEDMASALGNSICDLMLEAARREEN